MRMLLIASAILVGTTTLASANYECKITLHWGTVKAGFSKNKMTWFASSGNVESPTRVLKGRILYKARDGREYALNRQRQIRRTDRDKKRVGKHTCNIQKASAAVNGD